MSAIRTDPDIVAALEDALAKAGKAKVLQTLFALLEKEATENKTLTIIVNEGIHNLPEEYKRGEVFVASRGSFDFSSTQSIHEEFGRVLKDAARKLKSRSWNRVYIVPFGPTALSMQMKLLVYWVCGLESIEVMNISGEPRVDVSIDLRDLIVKSNAAQ